MAIEVTTDLVEHVAELARLALSGDEKLALEEHFRRILSYVASFDTLSTEGVEPSHLSVATSNVFRDDVPRPSLGVGEALRNAPAAAAPYFLVPRIIGEPEGARGAP